jgi:hypothetical protein
MIEPHLTVSHPEGGCEDAVKLLKGEYQAGIWMGRYADAI